jgi:hypothetical protein
MLKNERERLSGVLPDQENERATEARGCPQIHKGCNLTGKTRRKFSTSSACSRVASEPGLKARSRLNHEAKIHRHLESATPRQPKGKRQKGGTTCRRLPAETRYPGKEGPERGSPGKRKRAASGVARKL